MMAHRYFPLVGLTGLAALFLGTAPVSGQTPNAPAKVAPKSSTIKRMPDGHPDLQGIYDVATLTPVDRRGPNLVLTKEEAAKLEADAAQLSKQGDQAIQGDRNAPPKGGDGSVGAAGNVGGYNRGWLDGLIALLA